MQSSGGGGTSSKLILLRILIIVKVDIITLEVLVLRGKFGRVEVVMDVRVGLLAQGAPVVRSCTVLSKRLVQSSLGHYRRRRCQSGVLLSEDEFDLQLRSFKRAAG